MADIETDVLIIGSGPAGGGSALLLSTYGINNVLVSKPKWLSDSPRAHITNQGAMEIFRDMGIEQDAIDKATPHELMGDNAFVRSMVGEELGRMHSWATHPNRDADYRLASPSMICDLPQDLFEPIVINAAGSRGSSLRFETEYLSHEQDDDGITATVKDHLTNQEYSIRAKYMIGADGGRSQVAKDLDLPFEGETGKGGSINIVFEADLSQYVAHRPSVLYWVIQPELLVSGLGLGVMRMVRPWNKWMAIGGYDIAQGPPDLDDDAATAIVHGMIGEEVPIRIESTSLWTVNHLYATQISKGRVFCMGDAIHRHPPTNGLGSNTSIQDAYNLCWKLAMVIKGQADPALLNTYNDERVPVAKQIVDRANKSIDDTGAVLAQLGLFTAKNPEEMASNMTARKDNTAEAADQREAIRQAILNKSYEFNCHGIEMNQRYRSDAVASDGTEEPPFIRDAELYYHPTTWPGARLPHAWLGRDKEKLSTKDIAGKGAFCLFTGIGGETWVEAANKIATERGMVINTCVVGPDRDAFDMYSLWTDIREVTEAGCLLVRPDNFVAWRCNDCPDNAEDQLANAFSQILQK